jgi:hypothetical protein
MISEKERAILRSPDRARIHEAIDAIRHLGYLTPRERTALLTYTTVVIQKSQVMDANQEREDKESHASVRTPKVTAIEDDGDEAEDVVIAELTEEQIAPGKPGQHVAGTVWYNNGKTNCRLPPNELPPLGFVPGRIVTWDGLRCFTNGAETIRLRLGQPIPKGFKPGVHHQKPPSHLGHKHYTDGQRTISLGPDDPIPEGFKLGTAKRKETA